MSIIDLNDDSYLIVAMKAYDNPNVILSDFEEDLKRIKYVRRLIKKYLLGGELKERLILNHLIILANTFGVATSVRLLFFKLHLEEYTVLKTFLLYLNYLPTVIKSINGKDILTGTISVDLDVGKILRYI